MKTFCVDVGAYTLKTGWSNGEMRMTPNCMVSCGTEKVIHVGRQVDECRDATQWKTCRMHDSGYIVNWNGQQRVLAGECEGTEGTEWLVTESLFAPRRVREQRTAVLFEEYNVSAFVAKCGAFWANAGQQKPQVMVDVGYSGTWVVPMFDRRVINYAVRRIDVGGKVLSNYLQQLVTERYFDASGEIRLMDDVRIKACYVARDFEGEMRRAAASKRGGALRCRVILPDYVDRSHATVVQDGEPLPADVNEAQMLTLANERIAVPELLLHPSDIGLDQAGIAEAIVQAVDACPPSLRASMYGSIQLIGGCAQTRGLVERVANDVRASADTSTDVHVSLHQTPMDAAWRGMASSAGQEWLEPFRITKKDYLEHGGHRCVELKDMI